MFIKISPRTDDGVDVAGTGIIEAHVAQCVSPSIRAIESVIADIAPTDVPVLLVGETGTGKEVVAMQIHRASNRRHGPFVKVRCSGLSLEEFDHLIQPEIR
ncbi:MAG: sigma 54-interacting transcriptional regulator, partial [Terriglobia bacterium]